MIGGEAPPVVPGHVLTEVIGAGATSVVWGGRDATGRAVAVKVPHLGADPADAAQLDIERQVLTALRHDHLVALRDVIRLADGRTALVFDRADGPRLDSLVHTRGHLRPGEVVTMVSPLCEALAILHDTGAIHGDVSPGNVALSRGGRPVLLDLGAARLAGSGPGVVLGTEGFTAPEVREGDRPSSAADLFSIGAIAWFCLTGNGAPDTDRRLDADIIRSHVGPELAEVIGACIDPDPACRPGAAAAARLFFDAVVPEAVEVVTGADEASALTHRLRVEAAADPAPAGPRKTRRHAVAVAVGVAVLLLGAGWVAFGGPAGALAPEVAATSVGSRTPSSAASSTPTSATDGPLGSPAAGSSGRRNRQAVTPSPAAGDPVLDARAPRERPLALMQALSDRRATALVTRDARALAGVHVSGSPSYQADSSVVSELLKGHHSYAGLRLVVAHASLVAGTDDRTTIRSRVDWAAYTVIDGRGRRAARPAQHGDVLDFSLVRGADGWRIQYISAASP